MRVLCFNAGSSSLKVALIDVGATTVSRVVAGSSSFGPKLDGTLRLVDVASGRVLIDGALSGDGAASRVVAAARAFCDALRDCGIEPPDAVGHRLVHGGPEQFAPLRLTRTARARLEEAIPFAPLHLPAELQVVDAAMCAYPDSPQVACFDTAFHATLPEVARRLPVPMWASEAGVKRYGFHGLSYEYASARVGDKLDYAVIAHLGSGASMAAVHEGKSVDTTMGMSPSGGLMMGTRTGDLDPGVLVYLMDKKQWGARDVERFVNHDTGLLGVSGTTSDMQALLAAREQDPCARLAVELFVYTAAKAVGSLAVGLGGLRTLVFTGGIGAHSAVVRAEIVGRLGLFGVSLDAEKNVAQAELISAPGSSCAVHVIEADEELVVARHVRSCLTDVKT